MERGQFHYAAEQSEQRQGAAIVKDGKTFEKVLLCLNQNKE